MEGYGRGEGEAGGWMGEGEYKGTRRAGKMEVKERKWGMVQMESGRRDEEV